MMNTLVSYLDLFSVQYWNTYPILIDFDLGSRFLLVIDKKVLNVILVKT